MSEEAQAQQARASALRAQGQHREALDAFEQARAAAARAGDAHLAARVQIGAVDTLGMLGRYDEAEALADSLLRRLRALDAPVDAAKVLGNLGNLHLRRDRYPAALAVYAEAEALLSDSDEPALRARFAVNRAIALTYLGRAEEALEDYRRAQALYEERGLPFEAAVVRTNIGFLHQTAGRYAVALAELTAAYRVFAGLARDHEAARCDLDTGDAYRALNLLPEARVCYQRALAVFDRLPLDDDRARAQIGLAALATENRRFADARTLLDSAEAHLVRPGNAVLLAQVRLHRANHWLRQGQSRRAREEALPAQQALAEAGLPGWAAEARLIAALADPNTSPAVYAEIAETAGQTSRGWLQCRAESALGRLLRRRGERAEALLHLRRAVDLLESARTQIAPEDLHLAFLSDREAVYSDLAALLLEGSPPSEADVAEALGVIERSRSRLLLERLLSAQTGQGGEPESALRERVAELRARLSRAYHDALSPEADEARRPGGGIPERDLAPLEAAYARALLEAELGGDFPETTLRGPLPDLPALRDALAPDETLLLYAAADNRLTAFLLRRDGLIALPGLAAVTDAGHLARRLRYHLRKMAMTPELRAAIAGGLQAELDAVLEDLHALLLAPLLPHLVGGRLIVVPCDPLQGVPFHALKDGAGYLLDRFEIVYAPSASVWHTLRARVEPSRTGGGALLVGVPGAGTEHVPGELAAIAGQMPARILCGGEATVENVRRAAPSATLLHLATHALFRHDNPLFSGLQLADDWLLGRDLYGMRLRADLVTLSACDTGASRIEPGEEWMGLARGFLSAGAGRVMVSLWPADDAATAEQMARFYGHLQEGHGPAGALRRAQREMRARRPHPYYWAAFCLIGRH